MEPRIQYAKTRDGVNIAYYAVGAGPPLVQMPSVVITHTQLEWEIPEYARWFERLASRRTLVRYDARGMGLSDRNVTNFSLDDHVLDLEAVADQLNLSSFALHAVAHMGLPAIAYAVRHPERVSHLILWCSYSRASDWLDSVQVQALRSLIDKDWALYTETVAHVVLGWAEGEPARRVALLMRATATQGVAAAITEATTEFDVTNLLPGVAVPTLVLHRRQVPFPSTSVATKLAAAIPGARLVMLEGTSLAPFLGDMDSVLRAIFDFLGEGEEALAEAEAPIAGAFRTILFTDIESSTALSQHLGDAKAQEVRRAHNAVVREALAAHAGSEIKHTGDGIMASFPSASGALECAVAIQRAVAQRGDPNLSVHIGLNAGEPIAEEQDLFGTSVDLARRICDQAGGGEILVSDVVRQLVAGKDFLFADRGEVALRGFEDPVRLVEVRWQN